MMAFIVVLILWILRRQSTITDSLGAKITTVSEEVVGYKESWESRKDGILKSFDSICHERQGACASLVDSKLENVDMQFGHVCRKFEDIKRDREKKWEKQERFNDRIKE